MSTLLTKQESATLARVSASTVHRWTKVGGLPSVHIGGIVRIDQADLETFLGKRISPAPEPESPSSLRAAIELPTEQVARHFSKLLPYLIQSLREAPEYGEISISASVHSGEIRRIRVGSDVSLSLPPCEGGGTKVPRGEGRQST